MKKIIREVDEKKGIHQVTIADERWYMKSRKNEVTGLPEYEAVPSVTWITQSYPKGIGYFKWLAERGWDEAEAIKTQAGDKGTKVHLAIEDVLAGKEVRIDSKYPNKTTGQDEELTLEECDAILSFISWKKEMEKDWIIETLANEVTIFNSQHGFAGTVDWVVKMTDKTSGATEYWVIDFKTSQQVWPSHELQLNAYKETFKNDENKLEGLDATNIHMGVLQVGYKRNKNQYKFTVIEDDFEMFIATKKIWAKEHGGEKPTKRDYPIILSAEVKKEVDQAVQEVVKTVSDELFIEEKEIKKNKKK